MRQLNSVVSGRKFTIFFFKRVMGCGLLHAIPILDISIRFGDICDRIQVVQNRAKLSVGKSLKVQVPTNLYPSFYVTRHKKMLGTPVPGAVCASKRWTLSSACKNVKGQHPL